MFADQKSSSLLQACFHKMWSWIKHTFFSVQYSDKEDKYEEEIKGLNDRLKEVISC